MPSADRTQIAPLLLPFFPIMEKATSDEWHGFLNAKTGLEIDISEPNANAFDKWRQALEALGVGVWGISSARAEQIRKRGEELKALEEVRMEAMPQRLALLAKIAPTKTAQDLIKDAKKAAK